MTSPPGSFAGSCFASKPSRRSPQKFNRYNRVKIRIEDEAVGARRFSGTFQADDTALLIGFLQKGSVAGRGTRRRCDRYRRSAQFQMSYPEVNSEPGYVRST